MPKKYSTTTTLVIVESPAKCKKIEEFLGPGYKCIASFGHLRELKTIPSIMKNELNENIFLPNYTNIKDFLKEKQIDTIKKEIKLCSDIIIATDDDREGEAIGWHICQMFKLNIEKTKRIVFHEITESAVKNAIANPTKIDMNKVFSQQARQILDLLVGYKISPLLWKYLVKNKDNALSAGRCQTPALKLIYDNYKKSNINEEEKVYNTIGYFTNSNIIFELNKQYNKEEQIIDFLDGSADNSHIYNCTTPVKITKKQPEPFTTSKLQQIASNELHYSPKETMKICQTLYEEGYITYMRTDSKTYSEEFIESCKNYISRNFEQRYINENINFLSNKYQSNEINDKNINEINNENINEKNIKKENKSKKTKDKNNLAQEAHEAIRPTKIYVKDLPENMDNKERKMYKLIWENTLESCMSPAEYYSVTATISGYDNTKYTHISEKIDFPGWKIVSNKYSTDNKEFNYLQTIGKNTILPYKKIISKVTMKNVNSHYTEARLIQLLEEKGIGRPSTYSSIVDKIQEKGYVKKQDIKGKEIECKDYELENDEISEIETKRTFGNEKNKLVIQPLGIVVIEFLEKYFSDIFNYDYTKNMEDSLDKISKGELNWNQLCLVCDEQLMKLINNLQFENDKKIEVQIDEHNTYLVGKYGPVIKNTTLDENGKEIVCFNPIKKEININISDLENGGYKIEDIIDTENKKEKNNDNIILGKHPEDNCDIILQKGKFGLYIKWGNNSKSLKSFGNRPIESITFEEIIPFLENDNSILREISNNISIRRSNRGNYIFFKTNKMKKPQFFKLDDFKEDYIKCDINIIKVWVKMKYNIY